MQNRMLESRDWLLKFGVVRFHKNPRFSSLSRNYNTRQTLSSIFYNIFISKKKPKMSQIFSNNIGSLNTTNITNFTVADDRPSILAWLSPLDPRLRHQDIRDRRVENVGEWVLQTEEFKSWCAGSEEGKSDRAVLFCYGNPGVGKTYIR